jgi:hypothetical protein
MDPTASIGEAAKTLYEYGGWGLAVILMFVIWRMARYILILHAEQRSESKEQYRQLIDTLVSNKQALESLKDAMITFMRRIE